MPFIRASLFITSIILVLILVAFVMLLLFFLPLKHRYAIGSLWAKFVIWWLKITHNIDYKIIGLKTMPATACVIMSNHQSTWETLVFQLIFPQQVWVLKRELLWIPIFGWGLALTSPIVINRSNKLQAIKTLTKQGAAKLKRGLWVVVFPEGTRQGRQVGHYQSGGAMIAKSANAAIIPVYHNAGKYWAKRQFIKKPGTIDLVIGKPIDPSDKTAKQLSKEVEQWARQQEEKYNTQ